ncbi:hypothetical protein GF376_04720 [Candidatus Peregrinibacteria bacterium]|nr:hypothetical protein [Candidatus Peregrinibacteria bacterium]
MPKAEDNQNNNQHDQQNDDKSQQIEYTKPNNSAQSSDQQDIKPKKKKSARQIEREKERRKKRRKKKAEEKKQEKLKDKSTGVESLSNEVIIPEKNEQDAKNVEDENLKKQETDSSSSDQLTEGQDVPFISVDEEDQAIDDQGNVDFQKLTEESPIFSDDSEKKDSDKDSNIDSNSQIEHNENVSDSIYHNPDYEDPEVADDLGLDDYFNDNETTDTESDSETGSESESESSVPIDFDSMDQEVNLVEENDSKTEIEEESVYTPSENEETYAREDLIHPKEQSSKAQNEEISSNSEDQTKEEDLIKAKEISENLETEELDVMPAKQGFLGRIFDKLSGQKSGSEQEDNDNESIDLNKEVYGKFFEVLKKVVAYIIVIILIIGAFWLGSSLKLYDRIIGLFNFQVEQSEEEPEIEESLEFDLKDFPIIETAIIFGKNAGDSEDIVAVIFRNVIYFGKLQDPIRIQQTGLTTAVYYGLLLDQIEAENKFIEYTNYLRQIRNIYTVDIYDLLNQSVDREDKLIEFIDQSKAIFTQGNTFRKQMNTEVDDLTISLNSLAPDKQRFEQDFFIALENLEGEKANLLLNSFVEVTQKQNELKAKVSALQKLLEYYEDILLKLQVRIRALETNFDALVEGIRVVNIPGANVDLVIGDEE